MLPWTLAIITDLMVIDEAKLGAVDAAVDAGHNNQSDGTNYEMSLRAELDSHANMICLGLNCNILRWSHWTVTVNDF